jgi:hypothetical protein
MRRVSVNCYRLDNDEALGFIEYLFVENLSNELTSSKKTFYTIVLM